jgi:hypothetical protein
MSIFFFSYIKAGTSYIKMRWWCPICTRPTLLVDSYCYVLCGEPANTYFIVFGLARPGFELMINPTWGWAHKLLHHCVCLYLMTFEK